MKFDKIEIHFKTANDEKRTVVIDRGSKVEAIILNSTKPHQARPPADIKVKGGEVDEFDGPQVCYQISGEPQCW